MKSGKKKRVELIDLTEENEEISKKDEKKRDKKEKKKVKVRFVKIYFSIELFELIVNISWKKIM